MKTLVKYFGLVLVSTCFNALIYSLAYYLLILPITDQFALNLPLLHYKYFLLFAILLTIFNRPKRTFNLQTKEGWLKLFSIYANKVFWCIVIIIIHCFITF